MEKIFHSLTSKEQNEIRREYKESCKNDYDYSIRLYIIYVVLGILTLIGFVIMFFIDLMLGSIIFSLGLILMIIVIYFLDRSNEKFYKFLKRKGYRYDIRKKR